PLFGFFFFQAEDGIRDKLVTGVQTCALPISLAIGTNPGGGTLAGTTTRQASSGVANFSGLSINKTGTGYTLAATSSPVLTGVTRSEERRVGKECRSRLSASQ